MNQLVRNDYSHLFFNGEDVTQRTGFYLMTMAKDAEFEQIKKLAKKDIDSLKTVVKALNQMMAFCDEGIKAKIY